MSQARFLVSAGSRALDRSSSTTVRRLNGSQRLISQSQRFSSNYAVESLRLRLRASLFGNGIHTVERTSILVNLPFTRTLSTNEPRTSTSEKLTEPAPPLSGVNKKAKIELRPGPAKPSPQSVKSKPSAAPTTQPESTHSHLPSRVIAHPTKPPPLSSSSPKERALKDSEGKGVINIAKDDLNDAARHGLLKPPPEDASKLGKLFHQAKELFKFYWAGLKFIFVDRRNAKAIRERVSSGGAPMTWEEHRFILTNNSDVIKLVPFLLTVIIAEELIPLIVLYVPGMLPSTCVLPSQRERIEAKRHERQRQAYASARASGIFNDSQIDELRLKSLSTNEVRLLCDTVGISSFGIFGMQRHRLRKYLLKIAIEDGLLLREGKGARLRQTDVATALCDRGFLAESYTPTQQRDRLRWWLDNVEDASDSSPEDIRIQLLVLMLREARP